jgi:hypothetical protein
MQGNTESDSSNLWNYLYQPRANIRFIDKDGIEKKGIIDVSGGYFSNSRGKNCYCGNYIDNGIVLPECFLDLEEDKIIGLVE